MDTTLGLFTSFGITLLDNKYSYWYSNIISYAQSQNRIKSKDQYFESHHIVPNKLSGSNSPINKVLLTAREHFIVHLLLTKMLIGSDKHKMINALNRMMSINQYQQRIYTSGQYNLQRQIFSKYISVANSGKKHTEESKNKMRGRIPWNKGKKMDTAFCDKLKANHTHSRIGSKHTEEYKFRMSVMKLGENNPFYGKTHTDEIKQRISVAHTGRKHTEETKAKISKSKRLGD